MGQQPFGSGSPAGYPDNAKAWTGSDALMKRIDWVNRLNTVIPKIRLNALDITRELFSDNVSEQTLRSIKRAESDRQARTLLFGAQNFNVDKLYLDETKTVLGSLGATLVCWYTSPSFH